MTKLSKDEPAKIEVTLAKDHTHAGEQYKAGDNIIVSSVERDWLRDQKVIA
jgi:hypothetical protein